MVASTLLRKTVCIEDWVTATKETKRHRIPEKTVPCD